jgi:site-specific recombinase XerD
MLILALYYTGARPNEVLRLRAKDIQKADDNYITIRIEGSKRGLPRTIYLQYKNALAREIYKYASGLFPEQLLFFHYMNSYTRVRKTKTGENKEYKEIAGKVGYFIKKWFTGIIDDSIPPYYLRHNRFSKLTQAGVSDRELQQLKGSKTRESIVPYQHMSTESAKKTAGKIK